MMDNTILIVDDVQLNIDALIKVLGDDYRIMAAVNGKSAIKLLERKKPDLVLLDVYMPGIDGFGVLQYMKERAELAGIPVIFVTGETDERAEEKGLTMGAVDYIKKPLNAALIRVKVRNHLDLKVYRDNLEALVSERTKQLEEKTSRLKASHNALVMCMSLMSESHNNVTETHVRRMRSFTKLLTDKIAERYPNLMTEELAEQTVLYSPLHDTGNISVSCSILKKTGRLTSDEFGAVKRHTLEGARLLRDTERQYAGGNEESELRVAIEIAEFHHEKYDGTGYPHGLAGEMIPLPARIVAIADTYDALRSDRPYKEGLSHEEAVNIILAGDERTNPGHFDPIVLDVFSSIHGEFAKTYTAE